MKTVYVLLRADEPDVLAVYSARELACFTRDELHREAERIGARDRFKVVAVDMDSDDKVPGQIVEVCDVVSGIPVQRWEIDGFIPRESLALHRPEWQTWQEVAQ